MLNRKLILAMAVFAAFTNANAAILDNSMAENSNADATTYSPSDGKIEYNNKNLANYQDPYLTNPRAYKSNQFGEAAPAPRANVFNGNAPVYNAREARRLENQAIEPSSGPDLER